MLIKNAALIEFGRRTPKKIEKYRRKKQIKKSRKRSRHTYGAQPPNSASGKENPRAISETSESGHDLNWPGQIQVPEVGSSKSEMVLFSSPSVRVEIERRLSPKPRFGRRRSGIRFASLHPSPKTTKGSGEIFFLFFQTKRINDATDLVTRSAPPLLTNDDGAHT